MDPITKHLIVQYVWLIAALGSAFVASCIIAIMYAAREDRDDS